jgi:hypothetical protein
VVIVSVAAFRDFALNKSIFILRKPSSFALLVILRRPTSESTRMKYRTHAASGWPAPAQPADKAMHCLDSPSSKLIDRDAASSASHESRDAQRSTGNPMNSSDLKNSVPPTRLGRRWHTSAFRWLFIYATVFVVSSVCLLGYIEVTATGAMEREADSAIRWELRYFDSRVDTQVASIVARRIYIQISTDSLERMAAISQGTLQRYP